MSVVTKSIVNADAEARYLSPGELDRIKGFVSSGERRLRIAQTLTESRERIVKQAGDQLFQKRPDVTVDVYPYRSHLLNHMIYGNALLPVKAEDLDPTEFADGDR